jgi:hypothetical protein
MLGQIARGSGGHVDDRVVEHDHREARRGRPGEPTTVVDPIEPEKSWNFSGKALDARRSWHSVIAV